MPVSETAIHKVAQRIARRKAISLTAAMVQARTWAAGVEAKEAAGAALKPPLCPGPRCQCEDCKDGAARYGKRLMKKAGNAGPGAW